MSERSDREDFSLPRFPAKIGVPFGLVFLLIGLPLDLHAFGILFPASGMQPAIPRWLFGSIIACFPAAGAFMLFGGLASFFAEPSFPARALSRLAFFCLTLILLSFFGGLGIFLTWHAISPFPDVVETGTIGIPGLSVTIEGPSTFGRVLAGVIGLAFDLVALLVVGLMWLAVTGGLTKRD